jgi:hypothetical protein
MTKSFARKIEIAYLPTSALLALLLVIFSWMLTLLLWAGRIITEGQWPGGLKLSVCSAVSMGATVFLVTCGRQTLRMNRPPPGTRIGITAVQALLVVLLVLAVGSFGTWLVWGPPFVPPWNGR